MGLSATAVRKRLHKLQQDGIFQGFIAYPSAECFGRTAFGAMMDAPLEEILLLPDVVWAATSFDQRQGCLVYAEDPSAWQAEHEALEFQSVPPSPGKWGPMEWRLAKAWMREPTGTNSELATTSGLSRKTVAKLRENMPQMRMEPILRPSQTGAIVYHLFIQGDFAATADMISLNDYDHGKYLFAWSENLPAQTKLLAELRNHPKVSRVELVMNAEFQLSHRLRDWVDAELVRWGR